MNEKEIQDEKIGFSRESAAEIGFSRWIPIMLRYHVRKHGIHENRGKSLENYCIDDS